ncbi:MAG TPA: oxygenase MpaB family protein [Mycobacterium sp.]|nr:oxygenase MpaB family protein [Mycobacterium sp.]
MNVTFLPRGDAIRRRIVADFERSAGRHDDPAVYGGPPGDPGLLGPDSMSWEVNADLAAVSQAGLPAIVLEILHPSVIAGVQDLSNYREDPYQRARATLGYVLATTFGNTEAATGVIERVKRIHSFVTGTRPDGVSYRALDPELIAWVHTCIPWMILRAFEHTKRALSQRERDRYLAEQAIIGRMGGADWVPTSEAELVDYVAAMRPRLSVNAQTREFLDFLMTSPFFPDLPAPVDRRLHRFVIYAGMSRAPGWAGELIGYDRPSGLTRRLIEPALQFDARQLRWALGTPRCVQLARERVAGARTELAIS